MSSTPAPPSPLALPDTIRVERLHHILDAARDKLIEAMGKDLRLSKADEASALGSTSGLDQSLLGMFIAFARSREHEGGVVTKKDVEAAATYAKQRIEQRLDSSGEGELDGLEIARATRITLAAVAIAARELRGDQPESALPPVIEQAYVSGQLTTTERNGRRTVRVTTLPWSEGPTIETLVTELLKADMLRDMNELRIGLISAFEGDSSYAAVLGLLREAGPFASLRKVVVGDFAFPDEWEISWVQLGNCDAVFELGPNVYEVELQGGGLELGELSNDRLRTLRVRTGGLSQATAAKLANADLPSLYDLELWFGAPDYGGDAELATIEPIFTNRLPKLRRLGLRNSGFADAIAARLVAAPELLAQLFKLDLSLGTLTATGSAKLEALGPSVQERSFKLDVSDNALSLEARRALEDALGTTKVVIGDQSKYEWGEGEYYVSVSE